jgi:chorismate lyase
LRKRSVLFHRRPEWSVVPHGIKLMVPETVRSWLFESHSLTARLRAAFGMGIGVRVLRQCWTAPYFDEAKLLGLRHGRFGLIREVVLHDRGIPLVLARSIIPPEALHGAQCRLAHLGNRPLGELLFAYPGLRREALELALIEPGDWCSEAGSRVSVPVWGRRSVYRVARGRVLVGEFFLPAVHAVPDSCP